MKTGKTNNKDTSKMIAESRLSKTECTVYANENSIASFTYYQQTYQSLHAMA